ncbi:MAG: ATP-dependent 6-phosphofructokinase [Chloroflexota bacterium]|nr:ATP-dependent 6-phosphofructokinase [Chloroflexota bacterium]
MSDKRLGILTGGGDCPGLNAAIRATTKAAMQRGYEVIGICNGWKGFIDNETQALDNTNTSGIIDRGGTILGTSRFSPTREENGVRQVMDAFQKLGLEALVVLGGHGTLSVTSQMFKLGLPVVGIPKTIDNDIAETDYTIGFQTAVQIATDALDRLRSTAESHHRAMILEVMGNSTGWIATYAGMANGADAILIPEIPFNEEKLDRLCELLQHRIKRGRNFSIIVVAEGTRLEGRPVVVSQCKGVGEVLGEAVQEHTGLETRVSVLGYIQRGGTPVAYDRSLAISFGVKAAELVEKRLYGQMVALQGNRVATVPLAEVEGRVKTVPLDVYRTAEIFFY